MMGCSDLETLPPCEEYCFCKWLYEATQKYFEDPEVKARFEKWQKERAVSV